MNASLRDLALVFLALAAIGYLSGCGARTEPPKPADTHVHAEGEHTEHEAGAHAEQHGEGHAEDGHHHAPLSADTVPMPASFQAGIERLEQLHGQIQTLIQSDELSKVHRVAEEMALVARKMKELARHELPEDKQTEAGRLCNEVAAYFPPIDEAADAGKKAETQAVHEQMAATITKLKAVVK